MCWGSSAQSLNVSDLVRGRGSGEGRSEGRDGRGEKGVQRVGAGMGRGARREGTESVNLMLLLLRVSLFFFLVKKYNYTEIKYDL